MSEPTVLQGSGTIYDAPNQQVVRTDESGPADEGTGGPRPEEQNGLTKPELLEKARSIGASPANNAMTKAELEASIAAREAELAGVEEEV